MALSDPDAISAWVRARGHEGPPPDHDWSILVAIAVYDDDRSVRALCVKCGLIRRKPVTLTAEMFVDLSGPCPGDSAYYRELQEERAKARQRG